MATTKRRKLERNGAPSTDTVLDEFPPYDAEIERNVLASLIWEPLLEDKVFDVSRRDFYLPENQEILGAIHDVAKDGPPTLASVSAKLPKRSAIRKEVMAIEEPISPDLNFPGWLSDLRALTSKRQLWRTHKRFGEALSSDRSPVDIIEEIQAALIESVDVENVEFVEFAKVSDGSSGVNSTNSTNSTPTLTIPRPSLLADYLDTYREILESDDKFIIGSILPVAAACLGRNVWMHWSGGRMFANLFTMLAGRAGDRKSIALDVADELAREVLKPKRFLPETCSVEGLFDEYDESEGGDPDKLLMVTEGNTMLSTWQKSQYGERVCKQMLRLYDCKGMAESFRQNKKEEEAPVRREIHETSTSMAVAATLNVCRFQGQAVRSGIARRFLYYFADGHGRFLPFPPAVDHKTRDELKTRFYRLTQIPTECRMTRDAQAFWESYQRENRILMAEEQDNEAALSVLNSAPTQALKMAMVFGACVGELSFDGSITEEILRLACAHVDECRESAKLLESVAERERWRSVAESILAKIRAEHEIRGNGHGPRNAILLTKTDLTKRFAPNPHRGERELSPDDLYQRIIPLLVRAGDAKLYTKEGKRETWAFRR